VQFLKEDALRFLDIHTLLELPSNEHSQDSLHAALPGPNNNHHAAASGPIDNQSGDVSDPCALALSVPSSEAEHPRKTPQNEDQPVSGLSITPSQTLLSQILIYDVCGVCFMGCFGSDCAQLAECGHIFCRACLAEFCKVQITEGNVQGVTCPQADCTATPTPAQVRSLVGEDLFSRYDRLLLQNALDCMPDVVYCPRLTCGLAVIHEKSSKAAVCSVCSFAFCVTCRNTYHAAEDCVCKGIEALWDDYASGSKQRKHLLETRYGRVFHFTVVEYLSQNWVAVNSKNCPHCFWRIQKISGCNVMTCSKCKLLFCWACLTKLPDNISKHFMGNPCSQY
uniref:RBR-type E3 ubiquitin transferase n=1 Tax=Mola mola TaxID=94237 RepID=A0A3Q3VMT0_MOLML